MADLPAWDSSALASHPVFEALAPVVKDLRLKLGKISDFGPKIGHMGLGLPTIDALQRYLNSLISKPKSGCGIDIKIIEQKSTQRRSRSEKCDEGWEGNYQLRLFLKGELFTRAQSYHDLFNLLVHIQFPLSKAGLNARHFLCIDESAQFPWKAKVGQNRGAEQDLLTHLDEGGVLVVSENFELLQLLQDRQWHKLFVEKRVDLLKHMKFFVFGHAIYEDVLKGHQTPHGLGVALHAPNGFFKRSLTEQLHWADQILSDVIAARESFKAVSCCFPVPLLGYPGWSLENNDESYYSNSVYFR